ncbi:MAG TPA: DUF4340 domain-containing protein [Candidatus Omnitrophota bacterium]|nr:DUF4340 domain-containing protein [Candidatus Omnitrophota bacterium]
MNFGRTIIFSILFALVVGVYGYQQHLQKQALVNVPDEVNRKVFFEKSNKIRQIEILDHVKNSRIVLRNNDGKWSLESPVRYPADFNIVEGLAMTARWFGKQPRLRAEKDWEEYGLAKPEVEMMYEVTGKKAEKLLIGAKSPIGDAVFCKWDSERGYFLIPSAAKAALLQSVYSLREKRVFRLPEEAYGKVSVEMGKHSYQWKRDQGDWFWLEPVSKFGKKIPIERMRLILNALQNLYIKEYLDENKKSKAELGFFIIHDRIRIEAGPGVSEVFHFGNEVPEKNAYYGFREGEDVVFLIDREKVFEFLDLLEAIEKGKIFSVEKVAS